MVVVGGGGDDGGGCGGGDDDDDVICAQPSTAHQVSMGLSRSMMPLATPFSPVTRTWYCWCSRSTAWFSCCISVCCGQRVPSGAW